MAKSARASTIKANNRNLKAKVFGPTEISRNERLSAKLRQIAAQPKPQRPVPEEEMADAEVEGAMDVEQEATASKTEEVMDVDAGKKPEAIFTKNLPSTRILNRRKIEKKNKNRKPRNLVTFKGYSKGCKKRKT